MSAAPHGPEPSVDDRPLSELAEEFGTAERRAKDRLIESLDAIAPERDRWRARSRYYHDSIERIVHFVVPDGAR